MALMVQGREVVGRVVDAGRGGPRRRRERPGRFCIRCADGVLGRAWVTRTRAGARVEAGVREI